MRKYALVLFFIGCTPAPPAVSIPNDTDAAVYVLPSASTAPSATPKSTALDLDRACERLADCDRGGIEGCCVDCRTPPRGGNVITLGDMALSITKSCAERILRAPTCKDVQHELDNPTCESP